MIGSVEALALSTKAKIVNAVNLASFIGSPSLVY
jgi:hypothetical protein